MIDFMGDFMWRVCWMWKASDNAAVCDAVISSKVLVSEMEASSAKLQGTRAHSHTCVSRAVALA